MNVAVAGRRPSAGRACPPVLGEEIVMRGFVRAPRGLSLVFACAVVVVASITGSAHAAITGHRLIVDERPDHRPT